MIGEYNCADLTSSETEDECTNADGYQWVHSVGTDSDGQEYPKCECRCQDGFCPPYLIQNQSTCDECSCDPAVHNCPSHQVLVDTGSECRCQCDEDKYDQCMAQSNIKQWDMDTCECSCDPGPACSAERSKNPETCECDCNSPSDPSISQCVGNQVLTDAGGTCECQCNETDEMVANCFLADPSKPYDAPVNVDFAQHLADDGNSMRFNYATCMCDLDTSGTEEDTTCPPQGEPGEFFPSDILSCLHGNFDFYYPECGCKCRPDMECFGNKVLNETSCECECSSSSVNFCNWVSGTLLSDDNCACVDYPGSTLKYPATAASTSATVYDTTIFDGASEAILSHGTDSEETMTLSSSTQQISNFDNVVQTDTSGVISFTGPLANNHEEGAEVIPVFLPSPPPQTTNDPHVTTFFGEKYDM